MSVTILETLQNANHNLGNLRVVTELQPLVKEQLNNATTLLEKEYSIWDKVEPLLEKYGSIDNVPKKSEKK